MRRQDRRGFTLVETLATLALLCFIVVILGPLLVRVSRQSSGVSAVQYRTAALIDAASRTSTIRPDQITAGCATFSAAFPHTVCTTIVDTLPSLRKVRLVVSPADSLLSGPDTVTIYRVNEQFINPFNTP